MIRKHLFAPGEYYHIYSRGTDKRNIFLNSDDYWRFMTALIIFQGNVHIPQVSRLVPFVKHQMFDKEEFKEILEKKTIDLVSFCLMSNHYHLLLKENLENGISNFMQRLGNSYTKYFNLKYQRTGHLFGSVFQSRHIKKDKYLKHLSAYIHVNPSEIYSWNKKETVYPWSSFQDYVGKNRWSEFLCPSIVLDQFKNSKDYQKYALESGAKSKPIQDIFID
ncbi:MAG: transposase [bacterium]|nr:transposase [bacterium]